MATTTPNYHLRKPTNADTVNVATDISANMDLLDAHAHSGTYERVFIPTAATGAAIQTQIDAANAAGGGTVVLSAYTEYLTDLRTIPGQTTYSAGIWMRSNVKLKGAKGSVIKLMDGATLPSPTTQAQIISTFYTSTQSNIGIEDVELNANGNNNPTVAIAHGIYVSHAFSVWVTRCKSRNLYGTASSLPGETMHFECAYGRDVHFTDCEADGSGATDTATGFSADNSFGVSYTGCTAHDLSHGQGFTHWQSAAIRYSACHAYKCVGGAGFNSERSEDITYASCISGGRSPNVGSDTALPWFTSNQNLGNLVGFLIQGGINVLAVGCVATYNATGVHVLSSTAISPTIVSSGVFMPGIDLSNSSSSALQVDASQVSVLVGPYTGASAEEWITAGTSPILTFNATNGSSGVRFNATGVTGVNAYRFQVSGSNVLTIGGGSGGNGDVAAVFNLRGDSVGTKYLTGAGKTTVVDGDFTHAPSDGALAYAKDTTTGTQYRAKRVDGAWVTIPESSTLAWRRIQTGRARFDAQTATTTGLNESGANAPGGASGGISAFYFDPADYPAHAKLRVRTLVITNATAPVASFTGGLYPTTTPAGAAATVSVAFGTVTSGSTAAVTTPALSTITEVSSSSFTPPTAGLYTLGMVISANMVANSSAVVRADLEVQF